MQRAHARRGIGRLEIIVVIVVLVIVASVAVALILKQKGDAGAGPGAADQSPEEQAKTAMEARNNLKQLGLSLQNHNDTYKTFPPLYFSNDTKLKGKLNVTKVKGSYPWTVRILPFIEEDTLYKGISKASNKFTEPAEKVQVQHDNKTVAPAQIDLAQLQSTHLGKRSARGNNNYLALAATRLPYLLQVTESGGTETTKFPPDGMIIPDKMARGQSTARMADGASKTAVIAESREVEKSNWYEPTQSFVVGFLPADSQLNGDNYYPYFDKSGTWVFNPATKDRTALNYGPTAADAKRAYNAKSGDPLERTWGPSGGHALANMTIHAMGDGSVLLLSNDVDPKIYFALITPRGMEKEERPDDVKIPAPPKK
jgi:hypothetical protein